MGQLNTALTVMTGIAFILFTNYMITDPGTTPTRPRNQFMFGSSVAFVYAVLMQFNIVYTLFFAVCIVCGIRGLGHWVAYWRSQRRAVNAPEITDAGDPRAEYDIGTGNGLTRTVLASSGTTNGTNGNGITSNGTDGVSNGNGNGNGTAGNGNGGKVASGETVTA